MISRVMSKMKEGITCNMHMGAVAQLLLACAVNFVGRQKRKAHMNGFACSPKLIFEIAHFIGLPIPPA